MGSSEIQGKLWGAEAKDYIEFIEPTFKLLWESMLTAAKIGKDIRFFDAGCGGGGASILAAGLGARVTGLDASEPFISIVRQRVPNGEFRVGDIEELPYEENSFDVSFSSQTLMFADNPSLAISEMKRVTIPNGRVVVSLWGAPEDCDLGRLGNVVRDNLPRDILPTLPPKSPTFSLSGHRLLEKLIEQVSLKILDSEELDHRFEYTDIDLSWQGLKASGPMQGAMRIVGEEKLKAAFQKAIEPLRDSKGAIRLENRVRYVIAAS
jgi:SAM-dependent methyltransferase